jgi:hypothetical protein
MLAHVAKREVARIVGDQPVASNARTEGWSRFKSTVAS